MTLFQSAHGLAPVDCQVFETHEPSRLIASLPFWQQLARDDVLVVGVAGDLLRRAEAALVDVLQHLQRVGEGLGSGDPLAAARVVQSVFARSVEQHLEALHRAGLAAGLAGEDVDRRDTGDLGLDRLGRVHGRRPRSSASSRSADPPWRRSLCCTRGHVCRCPSRRRRSCRRRPYRRPSRCRRTATSRPTSSRRSRGARGSRPGHPSG